MGNLDTEVVAYIECRRSSLPVLIELAERVDQLAGKKPPESGYGLAEAFCAILNGGNEQAIQTALTILEGWSFEPRE
jgi:iron-sulfur cluster repair protein YtfE (RIC family)